jgi:hypothetical protein
MGAEDWAPAAVVIVGSPDASVLCATRHAENIRLSGLLAKCAAVLTLASTTAEGRATAKQAWGTTSPMKIAEVAR